MKRATILTVLALGIALLAAAPAFAQDKSTEELAKAAQNPVADMISIPLQFNTTFDYGVDALQPRKTQYVMNFQPVVPFHISKNWNMISRTIVPFISQPDVVDSGTPLTSVGDIQETLFFSPSKPSKVIWGVGPAVTFPTATSPILGTYKYTAGPAFVILAMPGHWVVGALVQNLWSFGGSSSAASTNNFLLQYFVNYNYPKGWYFTSAPINTADWTADSKDRWTVPLGGGFGRLMRVGKKGVPINTSLQVFYNVVRPTGSIPSGPWVMRFQIQLLLPSKK